MFRRPALFAGLFCVVAGLLVLVGWAFDLELLKRVRPGFTAMNPLTAFCLLLSGLAVTLAQFRARALTLGLGLAVAGIALLKITDLAWGSLPVDQLLFSDALTAGQKLPNRMAPNTAVALLLAGLSLTSSVSNRRVAPLASQALGAAVLIVSMFALIGYGFGISRLHSVGLFIPMALHTGVALLVLSLGLISLNPHRGLMLVLRDPGSAGSMARTVLPLALLIPVAVGAVRLWGQNNGYYGTEAGVALQVVANVLVTSVLLISSIVALYRSDMARRDREQALARSEAHYRLAETVAHVGHWRIDLPSFAMRWSDEVFRICGIPKEKGVPSATEVLEIHHPEDRPVVRQTIRAALHEGLGWELGVRLRRPDGELRYVSSEGVCERDSDGNVTGLFGVFADVTDLEHARREAEAATAAKAAFLANMSHEIRTPLNGVMGFAELLLAAELPPEQQRHASLIFDSAQALLKLLNDILDVSKIDAGHMEVACEPFDLLHQLRQCVRLMESTAQKKGLQLTLAVDELLPRHVLGDGLRLRQVVLNLLGNALKFTDHGFVAMEAVETRAPSGERQMEISISDTGVGIPQARQASVFEEFEQADASISRRFGGSGLGLSISRRMISLMGGEIALESREGEGTRVTVRLPLKEVSHPMRRSSDDPREPDQAPASADRAARMILLVEDLDINQELIASMLARMGYRVEIASDGAEAIRLAQRLGTEPGLYDLIFMDVQMPVVDGLTATRAIRALGGRASEIPIVALTANAYVSEIEECRAAGMNDHLSKPVSMSALGAALTRWLPEGGGSGPRRRSDDRAKTPLAEKFAARLKSHAVRLEEIRSQLAEAAGDNRAALLEEARRIAHNLAGTAAMFGEPALGDLAAGVEDSLKAADSANGDAPNFQDLITALSRAA